MFSWLRREAPTLGVAVIVTLLVWYWAAMETRTAEQILLPVNFTGPDVSWLVRADETSFVCTFEGSRRAIDRASALRTGGVDIEIGTSGLPKDAGEHEIDMHAILREHPRLRNTGANISRVENPQVTLTIDKMITSPAEVRPSLPGVQIEGDINVDPPSVDIRMPQGLRDRYPGNLTVNAVADASLLAQLPPGQRHMLEVPVRPVEGLDNQSSVALSPETVTVSFAIKSLIREIEYDSARVQVSLPPEVTREFNVDVDPKSIENLVLRADTEIIRAIEENRAIVLAFVHLTSLDCESRIDSKPVTYFEALMTDGNGVTRGSQIEAWVKDGVNPAVINLSITPVQ